MQRVPVWTWRDAVRKASVPPLTKLVCWGIANYLSDVGEGCFPTIKMLMADTGLSNKSLTVHVQRAVEYGLLEVTRERGPDGRVRRTIYHPRFPDEAILPTSRAADRPPREGDDQVNDVHVAKPDVPDTCGSTGEAESQMYDVHVAKPDEARTSGLDVSQGSSHVYEVHGNYPIDKLSISPPTPPGGLSGGDFGFAKGWTEAAQADVEHLRSSVLSQHVVTDFVEHVAGVLNPPRDTDAAAYVRQLGYHLQKFSKETLIQLATSMISERARDLPAVGVLKQRAERIERERALQAGIAKWQEQQGGQGASITVQRGSREYDEEIARLERIDPARAANARRRLFLTIAADGGAA